VKNAWRVAGSVLVMAAAAAFIAACGGGGGDTTDNASGNGQNGLAAYQSCLAQHGVTLPSRGGQNGQAPPSDGAFPGGGGTPPSGAPQGGFGGGGGFRPEGVDDETWQKAQEACASVMPTGGPGGGNNSAFTAYRNCLTEHGVSASAGVGQLNTADAKVAAAVKACEALQPTGGPGGGTQPTSPAS
jgi:hypothetical protein